MERGTTFYDQLIITSTKYTTGQFSDTTIIHIFGHQTVNLSHVSLLHVQTKNYKTIKLGLHHKPDSVV